MTEKALSPRDNRTKSINRIERTSESENVETENVGIERLL